MKKRNELSLDIFKITNRPIRLGVVFLSLFIAGLGCAKFRHDYEGENFQIKRYQSYLNALEEQGFSFLPPKNNESKAATLNYYKMNKNWDASKISLDALESQLERIIEDGQEFIDEKRGSFYEYRSKKLKESGLYPIEQIQAHIEGAKKILAQIRKQSDEVRDVRLFDDANIRSTFGTLTRIEKALKKAGIELEPTLDPKVDNVSNEQLRGFVKFRIKKNVAIRALLKGSLLENDKELSLLPDIDQVELEKELKDFHNRMFYAVRVLRQSIREDTQVDPEFLKNFDHTVIVEIVSKLFGPFSQAMGDSKDPKHIWLKRKLMEQDFYDSSETDPVGVFSEELREAERASDGGFRFPATLMLQYITALSLVEQKYRLPNSSDYYLLVRGGARRAKAKLQAIEMFFRMDAFLELVPKTPKTPKTPKPKKIVCRIRP